MLLPLPTLVTFGEAAAAAIASTAAVAGFFLGSHDLFIAREWLRRVLFN